MTMLSRPTLIYEFLIASYKQLCRREISMVARKLVILALACLVSFTIASSKITVQTELEQNFIQTELYW